MLCFDLTCEIFTPYTFSMIDIFLPPSFVSANLEIMMMYKDIDVDMYLLIDVNETKN